MHEYLLYLEITYCKKSLPENLRGASRETLDAIRCPRGSRNVFKDRALALRALKASRRVVKQFSIIHKILIHFHSETPIIIQLFTRFSANFSKKACVLLYLLAPEKSANGGHHKTSNSVHKLVPRLLLRSFVKNNILGRA